MLPFLEHTLRANVRKGSVPVVSNYDVHFADWFDTAFDDEYAGAVWVAENVLRLTSAASRDRQPTARDDMVVVENSSGRPVRFLSVKAGDLFLAFDVPAGATLQLPATPQAPADTSWIQVAGVWADGTPLPGAGFNLERPARPDAPLRYVVDVRPGGVQVREKR